jgi:hypothetical protein
VRGLCVRYVLPIFFKNFGQVKFGFSRVASATLLENDVSAIL